MKKRCLLFLLLLFIPDFLLPQSKTPVGGIEGIVLESGTQAPLIGVNVVVINQTLGAISDMKGKYTITNIPVGNYTLQIRMIGYAPVVKTDVIVRPQRTTTVNTELVESLLETEQVTVTAGYFQTADVQAVSTVGFSREEIRRAPGSGGDVSRIILGLPSLAKVNDQSNSLIVRGGSPLENAFYLDGIEIPNINHFPTQGATGGPIGMINVDLIDDVSFYTGAFSPLYGDRLSSILDLKFREGNRKEFNGQLDLNIAGFGGVAEGPVDGGRGSYMLSVRRSYLDYLIKMIDIGTAVAPNYGDFQGKIGYDISQNHKLSVLVIGGDDHNNPDRVTAQENDMLHYGNQDIYQNAGGITWRAIWSKDAFSTTSLGYMSSSFSEDFSETNTGNLITQNHSLEESLNLRNVNHLKLSPMHSIEFGLDVKQQRSRFDNYYAVFTDAVGDPTPAAAVRRTLSGTKLGTFINCTIQPFQGLSAVVGVRTDYFSINDRLTTAPRASLKYQLNELTACRIASGMYYQNLPMLLLAQKTSNKRMTDPYAVHYIFGFDRLITEDTKFTAEVYQKEYFDFPVDPSDPSLFLVDEVFYRNGFFLSHGALSSDGKARCRGIELMVQKKLAEDFYGMASITAFRAEYMGADNVWRTRIFDNRFIVSAEGGYKPNSEWEFSARWIYAGGSPYTPLDIAQSQVQHRAVLDESQINASRYPDYHSLNVRFDKRFHFESSNLVLYLSVWNVYNRQNAAAYFWNDKENKEGTIYQWNLLPIFGVEYEL